MDNREAVKVIDISGDIGSCPKAFKKAGITFEIIDYIEKNKGTVDVYNAMNGTNFKTQEIDKWDKNIEANFIFHKSPSTPENLEKAENEPELKNQFLVDTLLIINSIIPDYVLWECGTHMDERNQNIFEGYLTSMKFIGYNSYYKTLNAKDFGFPVDKKCIYVLSTLTQNKFDFPAPQFLIKTYRDYLEQKENAKIFMLTEKTETNNNKQINYNFSQKISCQEGFDVLTAKEIMKLKGFDDQDYEKIINVYTQRELTELIKELSAVNVIKAIISKIF